MTYDGTWFLSYLCENGIIDNDDTVEGGSVEGTLAVDYWGLEKGDHIYVEMTKKDKLNIWYAIAEEYQAYHDDSDKAMDDMDNGLTFKDLPFVSKMTKKVQLSFI